MRKYILLYVLLAVSVIAGFVLYTSFTSIPERQEIDAIAVNDIVKSAGQNWNDIQKLSSKNFLYRASVIDNSGRFIWATDQEVAGNLQAAIQRSYVILDITVNDEVVGKALIETDQRDFDKQVRERLARLVMGSVMLLCSILLLFLLELHRVVIKPFRRLELFAHKISAGSFDKVLPMEKNNLFGLFTQSFDVMRQSLLEAKRKQAEAEQAKKELIVSLSHDIKTPVTSIKLIAELLSATNPEPAIHEKLKMIEAKSDQINRLMNDMMHSALEELGELKVRLTTESSEVLRNLFEDADPYNRVKIGNIPQCMVDLDTSRIEQVIGNIISNSYKYAGTDIDIECKIAGEFLYVDVHDYGAGVEPDAIELICTKFYRSENAKASQKDGEGLGLYITKLLMEKMGGGFMVYNRENGFSIRLILKLSV